MQQTELSETQFAAYQGIATSDDPDRTDTPNRMPFPTEWREVSDLPGLFLGKLHGWKGAYGDKGKPACRCDQFTTGNPDADDGLNELITGRYVLIPK